MSTLVICNKYCFIKYICESIEAKLMYIFWVTKSLAGTYSQKVLLVHIKNESIGSKGCNWALMICFLSIFKPNCTENLYKTCESNGQAEIWNIAFLTNTLMTIWKPDNMIRKFRIIIIKPSSFCIDLAIY